MNYVQIINVLAMNVNEDDVTTVEEFINDVAKIWRELPEERKAHLIVNSDSEVQEQQDAEISRSETISFLWQILPQETSEKLLKGETSNSKALDYIEQRLKDIKEAFNDSLYRDALSQGIDTESEEFKEQLF